MFTIHTSESPLLDYINFKTYRNIEFQGLTKDLGKDVYDNVMVLIGNMDLSSHENYLTWLYVWKQVNALLSKYNHHLKRPKNYSDVYENIMWATRRQIARERGYTTPNQMDEMRASINAEFMARRESYIAWAEKSLTALYNARATGKLATSHIVTMNRVQKSGASIGERLYRWFNSNRAA